MPTAFFVSHPEVVVDPLLPVPRWSLSDTGRRRMEAFSRDPRLGAVTAVHASGETKAREAAAILARSLGLAVAVHDDLGENDRSATGFLPPAEFEATADAFFARPEESIRGWERAVDAQARVAAAVDRILSAHRGGDLAIVAHGAVGTLLFCLYSGHPIDRKYDQSSQGQYWCFDTVTRAVGHGWRPITASEAGASDRPI